MWNGPTGTKCNCSRSRPLRRSRVDTTHPAARRMLTKEPAVRGFDTVGSSIAPSHLSDRSSSPSDVKAQGQGVTAALHQHVVQVPPASTDRRTTSLMTVPSDSVLARHRRDHWPSPTSEALVVSGCQLPSARHPLKRSAVRPDPMGPHAISIHAATPATPCPELSPRPHQSPRRLRASQSPQAPQSPQGTM